MPSAIRDALEGYLAGRLQSERLVIAVAAAYYGERSRGQGTGAALQPVVDVIDRAAPGIVELASVAGGAGFDVRLAERPFPPDYEADLRRAAAAALAGDWRGEKGAARTAARPGALQTAGRAGAPERSGAARPATPAAPAAPERGLGVVARVLRAVRRLFSAPA